MNDDKFVRVFQFDTFSLSQSIESISISSFESTSINRNVRRRNDIVARKARRRDERNLNMNWMKIKTFDESFFVYTFSSFRQNENICFHCDAYQYKKKCQIRNFVTKYWHCCFDDKISKNIVKSENDFDALKIMFDDFNKNNLRVLVDAIKIELQNLLWQIKMNSNTNMKRKIQLNIEFQELKIAYNNVFSFCNEFFTIDRINSV